MVFGRAGPGDRAPVMDARSPRESGENGRYAQIALKAQYYLVRFIARASRRVSLGLVLLQPPLSAHLKRRCQNSRRRFLGNRWLAHPARRRRGRLPPWNHGMLTAPPRRRPPLPPARAGYQWIQQHSMG